MANDYSPEARAALERLRTADEWLTDAIGAREEASRQRAIAAFEAHEAGVSYFDIASAIGVSKTTATRVVKDGEHELRLMRRRGGG